MKNLQDVFSKLQDLKHEQKELKASYRDALSHSAEHQEVLEKVKKIKQDKIDIESKIKSDFGPELNRLEEIKNEVAELNVQMSDIALTSIMKGERVEVFGQYEKQYEPILSVKFKRKQD